MTEAMYEHSKDHINIKPHTESHFNSLYDYCTSTNLNLTPKNWIYYNRVYKRVYNLNRLNQYIDSIQIIIHE